MDHRLQFVAASRRTDEAFTALCARFGIAPKTGYKWLARYEAEGPAGLHERSRRPHTSPTATASEVAEALLELRRHHPTWGGKKLLAVLGRRRPRLVLPAPSTVAALLKGAGLVTAPRRRRVLGHPGRPTAAMDTPNAVWTADFTGEFKTRDGVYCYPLTIADGHSRFLLACRGLPSPRAVGARPVFERLFREHGLEHGLPARIRSDNGVPFATIALARLSALSVWWVRLGILPALIEPSSPQQNGAHERMHRTLKAEATRPPQAHARAQQRVFDRFRREYNEERPHEALGQATPVSRYAPSPRPYPARLPALEYPAHWEVAGGVWRVYFGPLQFGRFDERLLRIIDQHAGTTSRNPRRVVPMSADWSVTDVSGPYPPVT